VPPLEDALSRVWPLRGPRVAMSIANAGARPWLGGAAADE